MAQDNLNDQKCSKCGSEVRPGSLFCFHCGAAIEPPKKNKENISDAWFKETIVEEQEIPAVAAVEIPDAKQPALNENATPAVYEEAVEAPEVKEETKSEADLGKLKSAASIRTKPKSAVKRTIDVVWEEPENSSNAWFIVATIILVLIALALLAAAWYLK